MGVTAVRPRGRVRWLYGFGFVLMAFAAYLGSDIIVLPRNTLERGGRWRSEKQGIKTGMVGGRGFYWGPQALVQGRLNLFVWHGFNEVVFRKAGEFDEINFRFRLAKDAYFYFVFDKRPDGFSALRLSLNPLFESAYVVGDAEGGFSHFQRVAVNGIRSNVWTSFKMAFDREGGRIIVNDALVGSFPRRPGGSAFGFRGGYREVLIDDVAVLEGGKVTLRETFFDERLRFRWTAYLLGAALLLNLGAVSLRRATSRTPVFFVTFNLFLFLEMAAVGWFTSMKSQLYAEAGLGAVPWNGRRQARWPLGLRVDISGETVRTRPPRPFFRVVFVGSSQTWGMGARNNQETFVRRLESAMNASAKMRKKVEVLNLGKSGAHARPLLRTYKKKLNQLNPDIAVINLSFNDRGQDPEYFAETLRGFAALNKAWGIKTLFVLEANSPEVTPGELALHPVMRRVAEEEGVPVVDLHGCLTGRRNSGILWWDVVHLTSYGHKAAAECLLAPLLDLLTQASIARRPGVLAGVRTP